eukprot:gnl/TRDRNA2_/TRDRNA2_193249_c0_seq1.p1 gnl/TRDRNA2_/TRDRNA2_193249_c0~~gnl/TRDRNA2_/TRDRNA2_193249_c0_seq1.p1  ORF type:complete len:273 (+),score=55.75 gnl/TRDRNA2_/TRDRNA2_193249_c0_seq1:55-873(+)
MSAGRWLAAAAVLFWHCPAPQDNVNIGAQSREGFARSQQRVAEAKAKEENKPAFLGETYRGGEQAASLEDNIDEHFCGYKWLRQKRKEPGVVELANGMMYKVIKKGPSTSLFADQESVIQAHIKWGFPCEGVEPLDTRTSGSPKWINVKETAKEYMGLSLASQMMSPGDHFEFYIPCRLGKGVSPRPSESGSTPPKRAPIFLEMELFDIKNYKHNKEPKWLIAHGPKALIDDDLMPKAIGGKDAGACPAPELIHEAEYVPDFTLFSYGVAKS